MERWQSGRMRSLGKAVYEQSYRGFESRSLRQYKRRGAGVVERGALEKRCPVFSDRGFESRPLREYTRGYAVSLRFTQIFTHSGKSFLIFFGK
jgi:hypothetical protein